MVRASLSAAQPGQSLPLQTHVQAGSASFFAAVSSTPSETSKVRSSASAGSTSFMTRIPSSAAAPCFQPSHPTPSFCKGDFFAVAGAAAGSINFETTPQGTSRKREPAGTLGRSRQSYADRRRKWPWTIRNHFHFDDSSGSVVRFLGSE
jgi:hypothetical protein